MKLYSLFLVFFLALCACSSKKPQKEPVNYKEKSPQITTTRPIGPTVTAKQLANERGTNLVAEIKYNKGSSQLRDKDKKTLKSLLQKAQNKGQVTQVQLVSWADQELPSDGKDLNETQKKLANSRNKAIENFLSSFGENIKFIKVSMAESLNLIDRMTASDKSQIKRSLKSAGVATTENKERGPSQASKSIVMIFIK